MGSREAQYIPQIMHQEQAWFDLMGGLHAVHGQAYLACHHESSSVKIRLG
jgi:hypothetical protein